MSEYHCEADAENGNPQDALRWREHQEAMDFFLTSRAGLVEACNDKVRPTVRLQEQALFLDEITHLAFMFSDRPTQIGSFLKKNKALDYLALSELSDWAMNTLFAYQALVKTFLELSEEQKTQWRPKIFSLSYQKRDRFEKIDIDISQILLGAEADQKLRNDWGLSDEQLDYQQAHLYRNEVQEVISHKMQFLQEPRQRILQTARAAISAGGGEGFHRIYWQFENLVGEIRDGGDLILMQTVLEHLNPYLILEESGEDMNPYKPYLE